MDIERIKCVGFGLQGPHQNFQKIEFTRPAIGDDDILIEILYAGICHSDLHTVENHWGEANFPLVPGHEIVGKVIRCGKDVKKFKAGDYAGIGCMINSCGECCACDHGREQECKKMVLTYNAKNWDDNDEITQGGYSTCYVVKQDFAIKVDCKEEDLPKIPSLMCAGITTFSPIRQANVEEGSTVFIAGFGGLGHMAAQYLKAINCQVVAFDIEDREELARAVDVKFAKIEEDGEIDESFEKKFDFGIITIPYNYDLKKYMRLLHCGGKLAIVGIPPYDECPDISIKDLILEFPGVELFGSLIGGISETQLCVDFSIKANIFPIVEEIEPTAEAIDEAYQKMRNREVDGRFVIKMKDFDKPEDKEEITKHQQGGQIEEKHEPEVFKNYRNAQNSYIADELKDYASNPNDVRYIGEKGPDDWYPNLIFNGGWFIRPTEGQVDENGKPYTKEDYIKATEWLPASIGFIFGDDEKYRGKVRAAYPFPGKKTDEQYEAFLDMLRDRGIDVDDGTYDYHTFFENEYDEWQKKDLEAAREAPKNKFWNWPHMNGDYKLEPHITWPGVNKDAWKQDGDRWIYTPPKDHKKKDGTQYTDEEYIRYFQTRENPENWLNLNGKLIQGGTKRGEE